MLSTLLHLPLKLLIKTAVPIQQYIAPDLPADPDRQFHQFRAAAPRDGCGRPAGQSSGAQIRRLGGEQRPRFHRDDGEKAALSGPSAAAGSGTGIDVTGACPSLPLGSFWGECPPDSAGSRARIALVMECPFACAREFFGKMSPGHLLLPKNWCGREDSNFHGLSPTTTSTLRVYQFRHDR